MTQQPADPSYRFFDSDNHYYETRDCFTRFIEPRFRDKAIQVVPAKGADIGEPNRRSRDEIWIGDKPFTFLAGHSFERVVRPGALREML
jgi:hypothetical protein